MAHFTEDHKVSGGGTYYVDSSSTLERVKDWVTSNEASTVLETATDHVMLFTA